MAGIGDMISSSSSESDVDDDDNMEILQTKSIELSNLMMVNRAPSPTNQSGGGNAEKPMASGGEQEEAEISDQEDDDDEQINKRKILMDFDTIMQGLSELITTSLFCCVTKYLDKTGSQFKRKQDSLLNRALDSMVLAADKITKLKGFGSIYPFNFALLSEIERYFKIGIRVRKDDGVIVRSPGQVDVNTEKWVDSYYYNTMNAIFTEKGSHRYILIRNEAAFLNLHQCNFCEKLFQNYKVLSLHLSKKRCFAKRELELTGKLPDPDEISIRYICKQGIWRPKMSMLEKLKEMTILVLPKHETPDGVLYSKLFCVWDIESFLHKTDQKTAGNTPHYMYMAEHCAAMIAYTNSFNWQTKVFTSDAKNPSKFVSDFLLSLLECQKLISDSLRSELQIYIDELQTRIEYEKRSYWSNRYKSLLKSLMKYIDTVPVLGWNCSKYDLPVLRSMGFFHILNQLDGPVKSLKKTGSRYLSASSSHLVFLDWICFQGCKIPLRDYLTKFQNTENKDSMQKEFFPYGCLVSHDSLSEPLPSLDMFWDNLRQRNQLESDEWIRYIKSYRKCNGDEIMALSMLKLDKRPESPEEKYEFIRRFWINSGFETVYDILVNYIKADCLPLAKAIYQSLNLYHSYKIDILRDYISLPSFVLHLAINFIPNKKDCFFVLLQTEERDMVQKSLIGGPSLIFTRFLKTGHSMLKPHDFSNPVVAKKIIGFDQNNQYGGAIKQNSYVGYYAVRIPNDSFEPKLMGTKSHNEILYVEYFAYKNNLPYVRHIASSDGNGQKWIKLPSGLVRVDGFCSKFEANGKLRQIVLEYLEEGYSHGYCVNCQTDENNAKIFHCTGKTMLQQYEKTMERLKEMEKQGYEVYFVWECEFNQIKRQRDFEFFERYHLHIGPDITQRHLTESEALDQIFTGEINGFVELSCKIPEQFRPYFCEFPVIFKHLKIDRKMLFEPMASYAKKHDLLKFKQTLLVSSFHAYDIVYSTSYIRFLMGIGVQFFGIKKIIQFRCSPCLAPFIDEFSKQRLLGDLANDPLKSEWHKSGINNSFGYSIMDEQKRTVTKYKPWKDVKKILMNQQPVVEMFEAGYPENPTELMEVTVKPKTVVRKTPIQIGAEVLFRGKVELLKFPYEVIKPNLKPSHYEFLLTDTDSVYMAIAGEQLSDCLRSGRENEWKKLEYERFVDLSTEERILATKRTPLYWHIEKETKGTLVALSSKLYVLTDEAGETVKSGSKGIQKRNNLVLISSTLFENILHDKNIGELPVVINTGFMQKGEKIKTYILKKTSLHACYPKRVVRECNVHTFTYPEY